MRDAKQGRVFLGNERDRKTYWLDEARNVDKIVWVIYGICGLLLLIDPLVHKHGPFGIEHWLGFYAIFGLFSYVGLVLVAKQLRKFLMRPESYYDE